MSEKERDNEKPVVSVVTPCYNGEEHGMLHEYFNGLLKQNYENVELIFINDGSTDNTERIYFEYEPKLESKFHKCKYTRFEENQGYIAGINTGMEQVTGEYVSLMDSDDIMLPHKIESHVDFLEDNEEYGMVYSDGYVVKKNDLNNPLRRFYDDKDTPSGELYEDILLQKAWMPAGSYCFRRECLETIPKLKDKFESRGNNLQILCSIAYHYKIGYNDVEPVMKYVVRPDSLSHQMNLDNLRFRTFVRKNLDYYIIDKFGVSEEVKNKIDAKYKKREVLFYFLKGEGRELRASYDELKKLYDAGINEMVSKAEMWSASLMYGISFFPGICELISQPIMKTEFIEKLF